MNGVIYDISGSFTTAGTFDVRVSSLTMGLVQVIGYKSTDFSHQMFEQYINWVDFGLNSTFNPALGSKRNYYSLVVRAYLSCLVSDNYEIILDTKYKGFLYIDGIKYLSAGQKKFRKDLVNDKFYFVEIRIVVDQRVPDVDDTNNLVRLRWATQNIAERDIKPRNFYYFNPLEDNGGHTLTVLANSAQAANSTVTDSTVNVQETEYDEERRHTYKILNSGDSITGYVLVNDHYGNLRGPQGETQDTVQAVLYKNWVVNQTVTLTQDSVTHRYEYTFTPTGSDRYQVSKILKFIGGHHS